MDGVQVDGVPLRERRWGSGETDRCYGKKKLLMGGGRMEGGRYNDPETLETGGSDGARISVKN